MYISHKPTHVYPDHYDRGSGLVSEDSLAACVTPNVDVPTCIRIWFFVHSDTFSIQIRSCRIHFIYYRTLAVTLRHRVIVSNRSAANRESQIVIELCRGQCCPEIAVGD